MEAIQRLPKPKNLLLAAGVDEPGQLLDVDFFLKITIEER
jgi:hypothetical protein